MGQGRTVVRRCYNETHMETLHATSPEDMERVATHVLAQLTATERAAVVALSGDLGAGKTTLTQALARLLGVTESVTSPTFVLMKQYLLPPGGSFTALVHIDAYRLEDASELAVLDFAALCATPRLLICIEWPERVADLIPRDAYRITLTEASPTGRTITIHAEID
jgi:tRNA threonylcarbamoyladenosine biosynthesis protein TsaE